LYDAGSFIQLIREKRSLLRASVLGVAFDLATPVINAPAAARDRFTNVRRSQRMTNALFFYPFD
jgi:hypothetical protein